MQKYTKTFNTYKFIIRKKFLPYFHKFLISDDKDWPPRSSVIYGGGSASLTSHQAIYSSLSPLLHFTQLTSTIVVSLLFGQLSQLIWYRRWFNFHSLSVYKTKTTTSKPNVNVTSKSYIKNNYNKNHHDNKDDYLVVKILLDKFPYKNNELYHHKWHHYHRQTTKSNAAMIILRKYSNNYHVSQFDTLEGRKKAERMVMVVIIIIIIMMGKKEQIKNGNRKSWQQRRIFLPPLFKWTNTITHKRMKKF